MDPHVAPTDCYYWWSDTDGHVVDLAEETFHMPVSLGYPRNVSGLSDIVNNPIYSTGVGLLMYGKEHEDGNTARKKNVSTGFFSRFRGWFTENL